MSGDSAIWMRMVHIVLGSGGLLLGFAALAAAKFGRRAWVHRWLGRAYWGVGGWLAIRSSHSARSEEKRERANTLLRTHLILMGSSYIAAWTTFLVQPLGSGTMFWLYAFGPTVLGTVLISRASQRYKLAKGRNTARAA